MTAVLWANAFGKTILPVYYLSRGIQFIQMAVGILILFGTQLVCLLLFRNVRAKLLWKISIISSALFIVLIINITNIWQFYLAYILSGIYMFSYWTAFNIAYFRETPKEKTGLGSAIMFSMFPFLGIIAPPLAGFFMQLHPIMFWLLAIAFFCIAYIFIDKTEDFSLHYSLRSVLSEIRAMRIPLFLEGIWEGLVNAVIPIYTLYFINTPLGYGAYAAYLSITGIAANLFLGKTSDRIQKRVIFLYPLTIVIAFITFLFPLATGNLLYWIILTGIINFLLPLFWNISTVLFVDTHPDLATSIPGREIMLSSGRIVGMVLVILSFILESSPTIIFYLLGCVMLLYPIYIYWVSIHKKRYIFR